MFQQMLIYKIESYARIDIISKYLTKWSLVINPLIRDK